MRQDKWRSQYFAYISLLFQCFRKIFFVKDSSSNSLQNPGISIILNKLHHFVICDIIDGFKRHNFQKQHIFIFRLLLPWLWITICNSVQKTKYSIRCSLRSSTTYTLKFILIVYFLFSKKSKTLWDQFFPLQKTIAQNLQLFWT